MLPCCHAAILSCLAADRPPGSRASMSVYVLIVIVSFLLKHKELFYIRNHHLNSKQTNVGLHVYTNLYSCSTRQYVIHRMRPILVCRHREELPLHV